MLKTLWGFIMFVLLQSPALAQNRFYGGTTLVFLVGDGVAVLASDSFEHANDGELTSTTTQKIAKVGQRLIIGSSGITAFRDGNDRVVVDLQKSLPSLADKLLWSDPDADAPKLHDAILNELRPMTQTRFRGAPGHLSPHVSILVAGISPVKGTFALRFKITAEYLRDSEGFRVRFLPGTWESIHIQPGKLSTLIDTRLESVRRDAADLLAGRSLAVFQYPAIRPLHEPNVVVNEEMLREAAMEVVKFTIERDSQIGGGIQVISIVSEAKGP